MTASGESKGPLLRPWKVSRNCQEAGIKVGLRFTIDRRNFQGNTGDF